MIAPFGSINNLLGKLGEDDPDLIKVREYISSLEQQLNLQFKRMQEAKKILDKI